MEAPHGKIIDNACFFYSDAYELATKKLKQSSFNKFYPARLGSLPLRFDTHLVPLARKPRITQTLWPKAFSPQLTKLECSRTILFCTVGANISVSRIVELETPSMGGEHDWQKH